MDISQLIESLFILYLYSNKTCLDTDLSSTDWTEGNETDTKISMRQSRNFLFIFVSKFTQPCIVSHV